MEHDAQSSRRYKENREDAVRASKADAAEMDELRALLRDIDTNMRRAWNDGSLSADAWPTALAQRVAKAVRRW